MKGVATGMTGEGVRVLRVHYSADPDKDPETQIGALWMARELEGYPGGRDGATWQREYEINPEAVAGQLVFPPMLPQKKRIVIPPFGIPETWDMAGSFDYAGRGFSAFLVFARAKGENDFYAVWEFFARNAGRNATADAIKNCPFFDRLSFIVADPSIWAETQIQEHTDKLVSVAQLFGDKDIHFVPGVKGGDHAFAELINNELWIGMENGRQPAYRIFETCPEHIREMSAWRYNDWSAGTQIHKNLKESMIDKDNHTIDCAKYYMQIAMSQWLKSWAENFDKKLHVKKT